MARPGMVNANLGSMTPIAQNKATLCWKACLEMMFSWKSLDAKGIDATLKSAGIDVSDAYASGLKVKDNKKAAAALGMGHVGFGQSLSAYDLKSRLSMSPLWVCGRWPHVGSLHAVVVIGASDDWVSFYDPWYEIGPWEVNDAKERTLEYFVHGDKGSNNGTDYAMGWYQIFYWKA